MATTYHTVIREHTSTENVLNHGAVGDGSTNNAAALQAAHDALPPEGGIIAFPVGNFKINSAVNITKTCIIRGAGQSSVQDIGANVVSGTWISLGTASQVGFVVNTRRQVAFADLSIVATVINNQVGITVTGPDESLDGNEHFTADACTFYGLQTGVHIITGVFSVITRCVFWNTTGHGVWYENIINSDMGDHRIGDCMLFGSGIGILANDGGVMIHNCKLYGHAQGVAVSIANLSNEGAVLGILGNSIEHYSSAGIYINRLSGSLTYKIITITDNEIVSTLPNTAGILVDANGADFIHDVIINDNQIYAANQGIALAGGKDYQVSGNHIQVATTGIAFSEASSTGTVGPNSFVGVTTPIAGVAAGVRWIHSAPVTVAQLPTAANGSVLYVSNGTIANPVASGGTGCIAKRLNNVWVGN